MCSSQTLVAFLAVMGTADALLPPSKVLQPLAADQSTTTHYTYNLTATLGNPWVGLVPYPSDPPPAFPHSMENFYFSMAWMMFGWNNFYTGSFETQLNQIKSRGNQAIVRFYLEYPGTTLVPTDGVPAFLIDGLTFYSYPGGVAPDWSNTTLQTAMVKLIHFLGSTYDNDPRIAFFQVGFLGQWGEWHESAGNGVSQAEWYEYTSWSRLWRSSHVPGVSVGSDSPPTAAVWKRMNTREREMAAKGAALSQHLIMSSSTIPPVPTSPEGSCWYFEPSGCPNGDGGGPFSAWVQDTWGPSNGYAGQSGCVRRQSALNSWCGTTDVVTYYVPYAVAPPPSPPVPLPAVPTGPEGSCWYFEPSGCPNGDGGGPFSAWVQDTWGPKNGYAGQSGCVRRQSALNSWCGTTDIVTYYVPYAVEPPPPSPLPPPSPSPSYPPTPLTGVPFASPGVQTKILLAFNSSFNKTGLLVRYPDVTGTLSPQDIRIGFHDDSYAQDTYGDESYFFMNRMYRANALNRWQSVPIGGELRPEFQSCIFAEDIQTACPIVSGQEAEDFNTCEDRSHASWMWDNAIGTYTGDDRTRALQDASRMGVQYYLSSLTVAYQGSKFQVTAEVINTGSAPAYYQVSMQLNYPCGPTGTNVTFTPDVLSSLLPNQTATLETIFLTQTAANGAAACVLLSSPRAFKPIKFAVEETDTNGAVQVAV